MDISNEITKLVQKITGDNTLLENFKKNPVDTVKKLLGNEIVKNLGDDALNKIVEGVKAKIGVENAGKILSSIKGLFNK